MLLRNFLVAAFFIFPVIGLAAKPIENLIDVPVPVKVDGSQHSIEEVQAAIIAGCRERGWVPVIAGENNIVASILVRAKHSAEVDISYSATNYSIIYKSSENLDYNEEKQKIHRNYNKWVVLLSDSIQRQFGVLSAADSG